MTGLVLRLAVGTGRTAAVRLALVVLGTALAAALLLAATGVAGLERSDFGLLGSVSQTALEDGTVLVDDDPGSTGPLRSAYLVEPGLRRGVVLGIVLCVVPLLVLVAVASRVAARRRDERLAGLRLAGAGGPTVRLLAALDTAVGAVAGSVVGVLLFLLVRAVTVATADGELRALAERATPGILAALGVLFLLVLGTVAAAMLALRALRITPLGVARRAPRRRPRPWGLLLLLAGLTAFALTLGQGPGTGATEDVLLGLSLATSMVGLVTCGPWLTSLTGRLTSRLSRGPALLLAGRRLEDEPRAQARAMSAVVLVVLAATIAVVLLQEFEGGGADDAFYVNGFRLAGIGMVFSLFVGACGLLVTTVEGLLERRRTLVAMSAAGVSRAVLRRATLAQVALPVLPAAALAVLTGLALSAALAGLQDSPLRFPGEVLLLPPAAVLVSALAAACTLPALPRAVDLVRLRAG